MKFRAQLHNVRTFSKLVAALSALDKIAWIHLEDGMVRFIVVPDRGSQVWCTFSRDVFFDPDAYVLKSLAEGNAIDLEITLPSLQRALRSALQSSTDPQLRLTKRDGAPVLSMTIPTMTNPRGLGAFGFTANGHAVGRHRESTFGSADFDAPPAVQAQAELELQARREREKVVVQDMPVRVMAAEARAGVVEPRTAEADVNIVLPPLLQLKAVSDRFTKLASAGLNASHPNTSNNSANTRLELGANMYGVLRLRLLTDTLNVETVWRGLDNPSLNEDALPMPLEEHPSTRFREAGPDRFASVHVDGRDWSRVLSVGRLDGRVIASVVDGTALVLHVDVAQPGSDDPDSLSSITCLAAFI